jgi:hypothetical protein
MNLIRNKINFFVKVSLILLIFISLNIPSESFAETLSTLPSCDNQGCFKKPSNVAISSDGSFVLVLDSDADTGTILRKFSFSNGNFSNTSRFQVSSLNNIQASYSLSLNKKNNKALIFNEGVDFNSAKLILVDLLLSKSTDINSLPTISSLTSPVFGDADGNTIFFSTLSSNPELIVFDLQKNLVVKKISLPARVDSINFNNDFSKAILTHSSPLSKSISIFDNNTGTLETTGIDSSLSNVGAFQDNVVFDASGKKAVISTLSGNHSIHFFDFESNMLISKVLSATLSGPTISTISPDGMTAIVSGDLFTDPAGFQLYKASIAADGNIFLLSSNPVTDESITIDIGITPDQSKVLVLVLKSGSKFLKIFDFNDLSLVDEIELSTDSGQTALTIDPNGRYAIIPNPFETQSVSLVTDLNLGPIAKTISPSSANINEQVQFSIDSYVDPARFGKDISVCFDSENCATGLSISSDGLSITGLTPAILIPGLYDLILTSNSLTGDQFTSIYQGAFKFGDVQSGIDTIEPAINVLSPIDLRAVNSKRLRVVGRVNGTGSLVKEVLVNGQVANLTLDSKSLTPNSYAFSATLTFSSDGQQSIAISAEDNAGNKSSKAIKVLLDTKLPILTANATQSTNGFNITGNVDGTGSEITSILVNSEPVTFAKGEKVDFFVTVEDSPIDIVVQDRAGNKAELDINPLSVNPNAPLIVITSPGNGEVFSDSGNINVSFTVKDDDQIKEIFLNGESLPVSPSGSYNQTIELDPGKSLITVDATDINDNVSTSEITVSFISDDTESEAGDGLPDNVEVINIPEDSEDLTESLVDEFTKLSDENPDFDISSTGAVEISNLPPISNGDDATVELPAIMGLDPGGENTLFIVPQGFTFASNVNFSGGPVIQVNNSDINSSRPVILRDSSGRTFLVGFAYLKNITGQARSKRNYYRFQTTEGDPLDLVTTITIPSDANIGDAKISIVGVGTDSLADIKLQVVESPDVKVGKDSIGKPQINDPLSATIKNSGKKLILTIPGENFIKKIATIDGQLEKLLGKANFLTNVTFVPSEGITIRKIKVKKTVITVTAQITSTVEAGIKLFNVITPKGADVAGIVFPATLLDGDLETTTKPEELILSN